jgi:hypothetical protein
VTADSELRRDGGSAALKVEIAINADSLNAGLYAAQGIFFVNTTVRNTGSSDRRITVWAAVRIGRGSPAARTSAPT